MLYSLKKKKKDRTHQSSPEIRDLIFMSLSSSQPSKLLREPLFIIIIIITTTTTTTTTTT